MYELAHKLLTYFKRVAYSNFSRNIAILVLQPLSLSFAGIQTPDRSIRPSTKLTCHQLSRPEWIDPPTLLSKVGGVNLCNTVPNTANSPMVFK